MIMIFICIFVFIAVGWMTWLATPQRHHDWLAEHREIRRQRRGRD